MKMAFELLQERMRDNQYRSLPAEGRIPASILVPIISSESPHLLYTLRSEFLKHHGGQISFPGGRIEENEDAWGAALREAQEEIGLIPRDVEFLGRLDDVYSPRGYHIQCFVGRVKMLQPVVNSKEVQELLKVNLEELFDPKRHEIKPWEKDTRIPVHYFSFSSGLVWGVTGVITYHLRSVLLPGSEKKDAPQVKHPWWDEKARRFRWSPPETTR